MCQKALYALYNNRSIGDELHYSYLCQNEQIQRLRVTRIPSYYFTNTCQNKLNIKGVPVHRQLEYLNF
jgi:hypothetical protein